MENCFPFLWLLLYYYSSFAELWGQVYLVRSVRYRWRPSDRSNDQRLRQTPHHRPAKTVFSNVLSNSNWPWQWSSEPDGEEFNCPVSLRCKEQLKIGLRCPVVWRLTLSGVGRMITCRRLNILCSINTKGQWQIQQRMLKLSHQSAVFGICLTLLPLFWTI